MRRSSHQKEKEDCARISQDRFDSWPMPRSSFPPSATSEFGIHLQRALICHSNLQSHVVRLVEKLRHQTCIHEFPRVGFCRKE